MTTLDERITRHHELLQKRDEIDRELHTLNDELQTALKSILGGLTTNKPDKPTPKAKSIRRCSACGSEGHNAKTCPTVRRSNGIGAAETV